MPDEDQPALGCSKCRYSQRGCKRCKDPAFNSRKRGNLTSCSKGREPKRQSRQSGQSLSKASHGQIKQVDTKPGKAPGTVNVCSFTVQLYARYMLGKRKCTASSAVRPARQAANSLHSRLTLNVSYVLGDLSSSYEFPLQRPTMTPSRLQITSLQCQQISYSHCLCLRVSQKHHHRIAPRRWLTIRMHQHSGAPGIPTWPTMLANQLLIVLM